MSSKFYQSQIYAALRDQVGSLWTDFTRHEFVARLGDGTLDEDAFLNYLVQDYVFLVHYSRAWAMALVKTEFPDEMKVSASTLDGLVNHEMQLHVDFCARKGINESELFRASEALENLAYTRYVLDSGLQGDFLDMLAALGPCVLGYGEIGHRLRAAAAKANPYQEWIDTYGGEDFQGFCEAVGRIMDKAADRRIGRDATRSPRWPSLCRRFSTATRLEAGFWDMGLHGGRPA